MKLSGIISFLTLTAAAAHTLPTCEEQSECIKITKEKVASDKCGDGECEFEICMEIDFAKCPNTPSIAHTCVKDDDKCVDGGGFEGVSTQVDHIEDGFKQCQIVPPGGMAEFLLKDGNAERVGGCGAVSKTFDGITANCGEFGERSCAGKAMIGKECAWTYQAPESCGNTGGGGGDPHIKKWDGDRFSFHGECDLVLVHSDEYAHDASKPGLDLQIRTTIVDFYSYIESAALRIGDSVLEVTKDHFWVDGQEGSDDALPAVIGAGYTLLEPFVDGNAKVYRVELEEGDYIDFRTYKMFLSIDVTGKQERFETASGLLGDYNSGAMVGRDGQTVFDDANLYGQEWQVGADEAMLFREAREPQLPHAKCVMPAMTSRHLRSSAAEVSAAKEACAHKSPQDYEFCVSDVLATGDVGMAGAW